MKSSEDNAGSVGSPSDGQDELTGLPFFHSWKSVYLFVLVSFVLWITLLVALTKYFS